MWFQDEARLGQQGTITRMWAEKGTRPRALKQVQYEYAYIFGAVCPAQDKAVALVVPAVGTNSMLEQTSDATHPGRIAVLILDRAAWHTSKKIAVFPNIILLPLPPAAPELNPVEQLWQQLRDNSLANRIFKDYTDIETACCDAWVAFTSRKSSIRSLCARNWAQLIQNSDLPC